jgi:nucleoside diphosphate kinase
METKEMEQTLVLIKPDALKNSLTGYVISQLSEFHTGLRFAGAKIVQVSEMLAEEHYAEHKGKLFFPSLINYITGCVHYPEDPGKRRVVALVYQGPGAIQKIRDIAGPTNPHIAREKKPGTVRALGTVVTIRDTDACIPRFSARSIFISRTENCTRSTNREAYAFSRPATSCGSRISMRCTHCTPACPPRARCRPWPPST